MRNQSIRPSDANYRESIDQALGCKVQLAHSFTKEGLFIPSLKKDWCQAPPSTARAPPSGTDHLGRSI